MADLCYLARCVGCPAPGLVPASQMGSHVAQQHRGLAFRCAACPHELLSIEDINQHVSIAHNVKSPAHQRMTIRLPACLKQWLCSICGHRNAVWFDEDSILLHLKTFHSTFHYEKARKRGVASRLFVAGCRLCSFTGDTEQVDNHVTTAHPREDFGSSNEDTDDEEEPSDRKEKTVVSAPASKEQSSREEGQLSSTPSLVSSSVDNTLSVRVKREKSRSSSIECLYEGKGEPKKNPKTKNHDKHSRPQSSESESETRKKSRSISVPLVNREISEPSSGTESRSPSPLGRKQSQGKKSHGTSRRRGSSTTGQNKSSSHRKRKESSSSNSLSSSSSPARKPRQKRGNSSTSSKDSCSKSPPRRSPPSRNRPSRTSRSPPSRYRRPQTSRSPGPTAYIDFRKTVVLCKFWPNCNKSDDICKFFHPPRGRPRTRSRDPSPRNRRFSPTFFDRRRSRSPRSPRRTRHSGNRSPARRRRSPRSPSPGRRPPLRSLTPPRASSTPHSENQQENLSSPGRNMPKSWETRMANVRNNSNQDRKKFFCKSCNKYGREEHRTCETCQVHSISEINHQKHLEGKKHLSLSKTQLRPYSVGSQHCPICPERFNDASEVIAHMKHHETFSYIRCKECISSKYTTFEALTKAELFTHLMEHHFKKKEQLKDEDLKYYGEIRNYKQGVVKCVLCLKDNKFKIGVPGLWLDNKLDHAKVTEHNEDLHSGTARIATMFNIRLACQLCDREFSVTKVQDWADHLTSHLPTENPARHNMFRPNPATTSPSRGPLSPCPYCATPLSNTELQDHVKKIHSKLSFSCKLCPLEERYHHENYADILKHLSIRHPGNAPENLHAGEKASANILYPGDKQSLTGFAWVKCKSSSCNFRGIGLGGEVKAHLRKHSLGEGSLANFLIFCRLCHKEAGIDNFDDQKEFMEHVKTHHKYIYDVLPQMRGFRKTGELTSGV